MLVAAVRSSLIYYLICVISFINLMLTLYILFCYFIPLYLKVNVYLLKKDTNLQMIKYMVFFFIENTD
jgi:hypothetical protein